MATKRGDAAGMDGMKGATPRRSATSADGADGAAKPARGAAKAGGRRSDLTRDLRDFASTRPDGWSHDDWLQFLDHLQSRGHNVSDRDQIGSLLEGERLKLALQKIPGIGPARVKTIAERYGYLWRLRETDADQLAREADIPRNVAEKVLSGLRH